MIIIDNVINKERCQGYIERCKEYYQQKVDDGADPYSFDQARLKIINDDPITEQVKNLLESKLKIKLNHRSTQLQVWPEHSFSQRHIHDSPEAGDCNYTSMLYLNDDFESGIFYTDDIQIKPVPGRLTLFNGREVYHGVSTILDKPRYCIIFWWNVEGEGL